MSKRLYPHRRVKYWYVYDIEDICALYYDLGLHPQTVRTWIKNGLKTIDQSRPTLIYGNDLIKYIKAQNMKGKCKLEFDQFLCLKCKDARPVFQNKTVLNQENKMLKARAHCRTCKTTMFKSYKMSVYQDIRKTFRVVDVLELYDCDTPPSKTHLEASKISPLNESGQGSLF